MLGDISDAINTELQNIEGSLSELIRYMDFDDDVSDITEALNRVRNVRHRREDVV